MLRSHWMQRLLSKAGYAQLESELPPSAQKLATRAVHEQILMDVIRARAIDAVFDVGANEGQFARGLRARGYTGHIVSFEPAGEVYAKLQAAAAQDGRWTALHYALGARSEQRTLHLMRKSPFNSFLEPSHGALKQFEGRNEVARDEQVAIRTLDEVLPQLQLQLRFSRVLLKLDTQGFDMEVLAGAGQALACVQAIQIEASFKPIYAGMPSAVEAIGRVQERGFEVASMATVSRDEQTMGIVEADCLFVRSA